MANSNHPVVNVTELEQVCIVVHDLTKSMEAMWDTFGIGPWDIYIADADSVSNMTYHGKPASFKFKVARTHNKLGGIEIELIQPVEGDNIYRDYLKEHGEGIHHLGWHKVDNLEAFTETTQRLEREGFPCIMSGRGQRSAFAYFDTTKVLHTILEVNWWYPNVIPHPDYTFPG